MRHRVAGKKLGRTPAHRKALFRNMVTSLLEHEALKTTDAKAKELRRWGDQMITLGKTGTLHARRRAAETLRSDTVLRKLFDELAKRYASRPGGYTRVVKLGVRVGDAASMSMVELVDRKGTETAEKGKKKPQRRRSSKQGAAEDSPRRRAAAG